LEADKIKKSLDLVSITDYISHWSARKYENVHKFLTTRTIRLIIKLGRDLMITNIFTKFAEDRMKTGYVRERTNKCDRLTD